MAVLWSSCQMYIHFKDRVLDFGLPWWLSGKVSCQCRRLETRVRSLGQEGPLEEEMATCSNILAWTIACIKEPDRLQSMGRQRIRHDWATEHACIRLSGLQKAILDYAEDSSERRILSAVKGVCFGIFFFFGCGPFLKSLWNLLHCCFCFRFWTLGPEACGILAPQPGIKPAPSALEGEVFFFFF